jgi:hypothetical protein
MPSSSLPPGSATPLSTGTISISRYCQYTRRQFLTMNDDDPARTAATGSTTMEMRRVVPLLDEAAVIRCAEQLCLR